VPPTAPENAHNNENKTNHEAVEYGAPHEDVECGVSDDVKRGLVAREHSHKLRSCLNTSNNTTRDGNEESNDQQNNEDITKDLEGHFDVRPG